MCGRFAQPFTPKDIIKAFFIEDYLCDMSIETRYNIAPSQQVLAVIAPENKRLLTVFKWGLVPQWAKDKSIGNRMINARAETAPEKPSFRSAFKSRRCIIPAGGFYEWKKEGKAKTPYYIRLKNQEPMALAGLYEHWRSETEELHTCTILTTEPNDLLSSIHNRMPVILSQDMYTQWLDPAADPVSLKELLVPHDPNQLELYPVNTMVNSPSNDNPDCIKPAE